MTVFDFYVSSLFLKDVERHSLYIKVTLFNCTAWFQYWPRPGINPGTKLFSWGTR